MSYWLPWPDGTVVEYQHGLSGWVGRLLGAFSWMRAIPALAFALCIASAQPPIVPPRPQPSPEQVAEYYRQGAELQYKQLLAANQRIIELEARLEGDRLEREATQLLREMADWRRKVLGDAACTIEEPGPKVVCPPLSPASATPNLSGDAKKQGL